MSSPGQAIWKLGFQLSPIILTNGIAQGIPGGMLPIIALTETLNLIGGLLSSEPGPTLDNFFANYTPMPGATLIDQDIGRYPFANQSVAANAVIAKPLAISLRMVCPVRQALGYFTKLATMIALQSALAKHNGMGGTYIVATPSFFYTNCIMTAFRDATSGDSAQAQSTWQLDFEKPLLTLNDAEEAQSSLLSQLTGGGMISGNPTYSGLATVTGSTGSLAGMSTLGSLSGAAGASITPPQGGPN